MSRSHCSPRLEPASCQLLLASYPRSPTSCPRRPAWCSSSSLARPSIGSLSRRQPSWCAPVCSTRRSPLVPTCPPGPQARSARASSRPPLSPATRIGGIPKEGQGSLRNIWPEPDSGENDGRQRGHPDRRVEPVLCRGAGGPSRVGRLAGVFAGPLLPLGSGLRGGCRSARWNRRDRRRNWWHHSGRKRHHRRRRGHWLHRRRCRDRRRHRRRWLWHSRRLRSRHRHGRGCWCW